MQARAGRAGRVRAPEAGNHLFTWDSNFTWGVRVHVNVCVCVCDGANFTWGVRVHMNMCVCVCDGDSACGQWLGLCRHRINSPHAARPTPAVISCPEPSPRGAAAPARTHPRPSLCFLLRPRTAEAPPRSGLGQHGDPRKRILTAALLTRACKWAFFHLCEQSKHSEKA